MATTAADLQLNDHVRIVPPNSPIGKRLVLPSSAEGLYTLRNNSTTTAMQRHTTDDDSSVTTLSANIENEGVPVQGGGPTGDANLVTYLCSWKELSMPLRTEVFGLCKSNMQSMYNTANYNKRGWHDKQKKKEMSHALSMYLIVAPKENLIWDCIANQLNAVTSAGSAQPCTAAHATASSTKECDTSLSPTTATAATTGASGDGATSTAGASAATGATGDACGSSSTAGAIAGFVHFRVENEDDEIADRVAKRIMRTAACPSTLPLTAADVCYVYELQIAEGLRRAGLGCSMMRVVEDLCSLNGILKKIMCTCLKVNDIAMTFYKKLDYSIDEISPEGPRCEYAILSKHIK